MVPHRRWVDWLLFQPVLWARPWVSGPAPLAVIHGLMCSVLPLFSLTCCLLMLRGRFERLRFWAMLGILLVPLPGQIMLMGETSPTLQLGWVCLAFVWRGCPLRWAGVVVFAATVMWGLHPVAAPLFFCAGVTSFALSYTMKDRSTRWRFWTWAALFALASIGKLLETLLLASAYERANMHGAAWTAELQSGLLMTPFVFLVPVGIEVLRSFFADSRNESGTPSFRLSRILWSAAFVIGIGYSVYPGGWTGGLCYRKFGILFTMPLMFLAGVAAWRHWRSPIADAPSAMSGRSLLLPALLFAVMMGGMSLSWKYLCQSLMEHLAAHKGQVLTQDELPYIEYNSALNHWSSTSLSLFLQGWSPQKVHVWNGPLQFTNHSLHICPEDACAWEDKSFKLEWVRKIEPPAK